MRKALFLFLILYFISPIKSKAQHIYYKNPGPEIIQQFNDSLKRVIILNADSNDLLANQFAYLLKFYPNLQVKSITVQYKTGNYVVKTNAKLSAAFKAPSQRIYKIQLSTGTHTTLDSVLIKNLSFNSQLALITHQLSLIEDLSTGGFFNFFGWYVKHLSHRGLKRLYRDAEKKTLEVGLGYQLLTYNQEFRQRLLIDNWQNTKGYSDYLKHYKDLPMKNEFVINLINDLPIYMAHQYK